MRPSDIWAVTAYFNPAGYRRRSENYRVFRRRLGVPLVAVELSFDGRFELSDDDAEIVLRMRCPDVMWHKERLLNIGIRAAPPEATKIAWVDGDIVFSDDDWAEKASAALDDCVVAHLMGRRLNLSRHGEVEDSAVSAVREHLAGRASDEVLADSEAPVRMGRSMGLAWAARRDLIERHGLYDAAILGSGDRVIANAAFARFDLGARCLEMNAAQQAHYLRWAEPFSQDVGGRIGAVDLQVEHLWHGALRNRGYSERHRGLAPFDFDPASDLSRDEAGCWRWGSGKPAMHRYVREYFSGRHEDG